MPSLPKRRVHARRMMGLRSLVVLLALVQMSQFVIAQSEANRDFQAYPLKHISAADAKRLLKELLPDVPAADLIADSETNQILLRGTDKAQQIAKQLIKSVDQPAASRQKEESIIKVYRSPEGRLSETAAAIRRTFGDRRDVRVASNSETLQIFVLATPTTHAAITARFKELGASTGDSESGSTTKRSTRDNQSIPPALKIRAERAEAARRRLTKPTNLYIPLANTNVIRIEKALGDLFGSRFQPQENERFTYVVEGTSGDRINIRFDRARNGISVSGPQGMAGQLAGLVRTLDGSKRSPGTRVRIIPIRRSDPIKVEQAIEAYRDGYRSRRKTGKQLPSSHNQKGSQFDLQPPEQQSANTKYSEIELVVFQESAGNGEPPGELSADDGGLLNFEDEGNRLDRMRNLGPDVEIETLPDLDVIIIQGRDRDVDEVTRIIKELERLSAETVPVIEIYALKHVGGEAVAQLVTQIHDDLVGGRQGRVSVTPLIKPNSLLLIGWGEAVKSIKELIDKLDQPVAPETQLKVFRLRHTPANTASTTVQQFFSGRTGLSPKVKVTSDVRSNSLIVQAAPRDMREIELLLKNLDTGSSKSVNQMRTFKLKNSLAAELGATLQAAIDAARGAQGGGQQKSAVLELLTIDPQGQKILKSGILADVRITPDPARNSLIVTAPAESMDLLAALIRQFDETPAAVAQIKVYRIINGDAGSLVQMLRSLLPSQTGNNMVPQLPGSKDETSMAPLRFSVDVRTNSIIATGSSGDLRIIEALLFRLDEEEVRLRENTVYRLKNAPSADVARAINDFLRNERLVKQAAPGAVNPFQQIETEVVVVSEPVSNTLILSATPRYFKQIIELIEKLDAQPPQVMIQVLIVEVGLNDTDEFGIEFGLQDSLLFDRSLLGELVTTVNSTQGSTPAGIITTTNEIIQAASNTPGFLFNNSPLPNLPNSGSTSSLSSSNSTAGQALSNFDVGRVNGELGFGGLVLSASSESVSVLIRALQESRRLEILSRPQIMTLDNQPAFIQVGQRVPRIVASNITETGGQVNTVELTNVGILLGVTPRISPDGMVVMDIDAEKSDVGPEADGIPVTVAPEGTIIRSPKINVTQAQTTISAASGETVVLGGLITKSTSEIHRRVPWLADIPLLGNLFRYDSLIARRTELLIIMTPRIVRSAADAELIKQEEAARMHWCSSDVHEIHGEAGLCNSIDCPICNSAVPVIYPDLNPRGDLPRETVPQYEERLMNKVSPADSGSSGQGELTTPSAFQRLSQMLKPPAFSQRFRRKESDNNSRNEQPSRTQANQSPKNRPAIANPLSISPFPVNKGSIQPAESIRKENDGWDENRDGETPPRLLFAPHTSNNGTSDNSQEPKQPSSLVEIGVTSGIREPVGVEVSRIQPLLLQSGRQEATSSSQGKDIEWLIE